MHPGPCLLTFAELVVCVTISGCSHESQGSAPPVDAASSEADAASEPESGSPDAEADAGEGESSGLLAFPGAEGFGRLSRGGRGGTVCHVTHLGDSGPGSLRNCVSRSHQTVVFEVGGWITLAFSLPINASQLTIAGQTAPGGGIGIRGQTVSILGSDVVMRFLRIRRGTVGDSLAQDTLDIASSTNNVIVDHCSVGFGIDETFSMPGDEPTGPHNLTVQWTINAYALQATNHSAGSLLMANDTTIHHTLWALNKTRNPRARTAPGAMLDWVNNVIYGWNARHAYGEEQGWTLSYHPFIMANSGSATHFANAVGNYFIAARPADYAFVGGFANDAGVPAFNLYFEDNLFDGNGDGVLDATQNDWSMVEEPATRLSERLSSAPVAVDAAAVAYERVLAGVGATLPLRDEVDALTIAHVRNQTGVLITTQADLVSEGVSFDGYGTLASGTAPLDADRDGMPDDWETAHALDPQDPADGNGDADGDGYTNLEAYLNSLVPPNP
jgi:hypothetical protein